MTAKRTAKNPPESSQPETNGFSYGHVFRGNPGAQQVDIPVELFGTMRFEVRVYLSSAQQTFLCQGMSHSKNGLILKGVLFPQVSTAIIPEKKNKIGMKKESAKVLTVPERVYLERIDLAGAYSAIVIPIPEKRG